MTYSTLMVHLDGARLNACVLDATAKLADRFRAKVIGIAACRPAALGGDDPFLDGQVAVIERDIVTDKLAHAEVEFRAHIALQSHVLEYRSIPTLDNVTDTIADQARCADLLITSAGPLSGDLLTHADTGALILQAGRPVLVVPDANVTADFRNVVVAWNDTRECRRAIVDALPILLLADRVTLVAATSDPAAAQSGIEDIGLWLARHGITSDPIISRTLVSVPRTLAAIMADVGADLVVAGAYGHSRIREWTFGGVTRDLLMQEGRCTFLSH